MFANRRGFTLIEVLVALAIGGVVLTGCRLLLEGLADHASAIVRTAADLDASANAERAVRQIVENLALAPEPQPTFVGSASEAVFASWCPSAYGALEPCTVRLSVQAASAGVTVGMATPGGQKLVLRRVAGAELRYLANASSGGIWYTRWNDAISPPLAVGVFSTTDTLVMRIGERR